MSTQTSFVLPESSKFPGEQPSTSGYNVKETKSNESNVSDPLLEPLKDIEIVEKLIQNTQTELETIKCDVNQYLCILKECKNEKCPNHDRLKILTKHDENITKATDLKTNDFRYQCRTKQCSTLTDKKTITSTPRTITSTPRSNRSSSESERRGPIVPRCSTRIDELSKAKRSREKYSNDIDKNVVARFKIALERPTEVKRKRSKELLPPVPENQEYISEDDQEVYNPMDTKTTKIIQTDYISLQNCARKCIEIPLVPNPSLKSIESPPAQSPSEEEFHSIKDAKSSESIIEEPKICAAEKPVEIEQPKPEHKVFLRDGVLGLLEDFHMRRKKLSVQVLPAVDIRRPLVTQKMPDVIITPSYSNNDQKKLVTHAHNNVTYLEMVHEDDKPKQTTKIDTETVAPKNNVVLCPETCTIFKKVDKAKQDENAKLEEIPKQEERIVEKPFNDTERNNISIREELNLNVNEIPSVRTLKEIQNYLEQRCALIRKRLDEERELKPGEYISLKWQLSKPPRWQATTEISQNEIEFNTDNATPGTALRSITYNPSPKSIHSDSSNSIHKKFSFKKIVTPSVESSEQVLPVNKNGDVIDKQLVYPFTSTVSTQYSSQRVSKENSIPSINKEITVSNIPAPDIPKEISVSNIPAELPIPKQFSSDKCTQYNCRSNLNDNKPQTEEEIIILPRPPSRNSKFDIMTNQISIAGKTESPTQSSKKNIEKDETEIKEPVIPPKKFSVTTNQFSFPDSTVSNEVEIRSTDLQPKLVESATQCCPSNDETNNETKTIMKPKVQDTAVQCTSSPRTIEKRRGLNETSKNILLQDLEDQINAPPSTAFNTIGTEVTEEDLGIFKPNKPKTIICKDSGTQKNDSPRKQRTIGLGVVEEQLSESSGESLLKTTTLKEIATQLRLSHQKSLTEATGSESIPKGSEDKCISCNLPDFQYFSRIPQATQHKFKQNARDNCCGKSKHASKINTDNYRKIESPTCSETRAPSPKFSVPIFKVISSPENSSPKINKLKHKRPQHKKCSTPTTSSTSFTTDPTDYISDGISLSEGEVKLPCECSTSIGELHLCHYANNIRKRSKILKDNPQKVVEQVFHSKEYEVTRQYKYYDNWVTYYVNRPNETISSGEIGTHCSVSSISSPSD